MELWDVYNSSGNKTGRVMKRGDKIPFGDFHLAVDIWIINSKLEMLIQKRSKTKKILPNIWATTGGSVIAGESSIDGCIREAKEEIGIDIAKENTKLLMRIKTEDTLWDVWVVKQDFDINNAVLQIEEVSEAKWATMNEVKQLVKDGLFFDYPELPDIYNLLENGDIIPSRS